MKRLININSKILSLSTLSVLIGFSAIAQDYNNNGYTDYNEGYNNNSQDNSYNNQNNNYNNQDNGYYNNQNNDYNNQNNGYYNNQNNGYYNNQDNGYYNNNQYNNGYDQYGNPISNGNNYYNRAYNYNNMDYNADYSTFYNQLAPYGQWYNDPQYGYVWVPQVDANFRPYLTNGYWAMTQYGNMWMSQYPWGWATFHYGRWTYNNFYGWMWIPGSEWGPAWVNWRQGDGYYGWAPLGPGISISMSLGSGFNISLNWWNFIPSGNIYARNLYSYYNPNRYGNIYNRTTIINNTYINNRNTYAAGPSRGDVGRYVKGDIPEYKVNMQQQGFNSRNGANTNFSSIKGNSISVVTPNLTRNASTTNSNGMRNAQQAQIAPKNVQPMTRGNLGSAKYFNGNASTSKAPSQPSTSQFSNNYNGMNGQLKTYSSSVKTTNQLNNNKVNFNNNAQVVRPNATNIQQQAQQGRTFNSNQVQNVQQNVNSINSNNASFNQNTLQNRQIELNNANTSQQIRQSNNNNNTQRPTFNSNNSFSAPRQQMSTPSVQQPKVNNSFSAPRQMSAPSAPKQMSAPSSAPKVEMRSGGFNKR